MNKFCLRNTALCLALLFGGVPDIASGIGRCKAFSETERQAYIMETAEQSFWKHRLQTALSPILNTWGYGVPPMLRGLSLPRAIWRHDPPNYSGLRPQIVARFRCAWGRATVFTQADFSESLWISLDATNRGRHLSEGQAWMLHQIYPTLMITQKAESQRTQMVLSRKTIPENDSFEESARSLLVTLFDDPLNKLGLQTIPVETRFRLPKEILAWPALADHREFLGNFGEWSSLRENETHAERKSDTVSARRLRLRINLNSKTISVSLTTNFLRRETLASLRRIVSAASESGLASSLGSLPTVSVHNITSVSVDGLSFNRHAMAFIELLDQYQTEGNFEDPLTDLPDKIKKDVKIWLGIQGQLNQDELMPDKIRYEELVVRDL